ncbi:MAG: TonB-dependent receptor [Bacteroidales bacterium]|nr:TonB-dependent receptor [Bacteroidales bacterium]
MMLRLAFVTAFLLFSLGLYSQQEIRGTVFDDNMQTLPGATVYLKVSGVGTTTSRDGSFVISKDEASLDTLVISYVGFEAFEAVFGEDQFTYVNQVFLNPKPYLAKEVKVYGSRAGNKTPMAYQDISKYQLREANTGNDMTYLLARTPSVVTTSEAGIGIGYTAMRIRGSDPTRINVTIDGIPVNDSESQSVFWVNMPDFASSVSSVQIQRGVGTSTQGAAAFGATVNLQTDERELAPYAEYGLVAGSFNTFRHTLKAGTGLIARHFTLDARVSKLNSDGYIDHSFSDHKSLFVKGTYHAKNTQVRLSVMHGHEVTGISWWGVPDYMIDSIRTYNPAGIYYDREGTEHYYENQTDNYKQTHYHLHVAHTLSEQLKLNAALHYTRGAGYYEQYQDDDNSYHTTELEAYGLAPVIDGPDTTYSSDLARQKWMDNHFFGLTAAASYSIDQLNVTGGFGWNKYLGDHFGEIIWIEQAPELPTGTQWYFNSGDKTDWNLYARANYALDEQINIFADMQFRHISYALNGTDDDRFAFDQEHTYNFLNPKAGVYYDIAKEHKAYASFAIAHREPTRADFKEAKGDPDATPLPERLTDLEIGYKYQINRLSVDVNLYNMQYKDQLIPTGEKSNVGYDIMTNVDKSFRRGIELESRYEVLDNFWWTVQLTLSDNKIRDYVEYASHYDADWNEEILARPLGNTSIAYSPNLIAANRLSYLYAFNEKHWAQVSLSSKYVGKQYFDNTSSEDRKIDPYFVTDLKLEYSVRSRFVGQTSIFLQVNNLFNAKHINNAYGGNWYEQENELTWAYYYPQAGMHFFAGLNVRF